MFFKTKQEIDNASFDPSEFPKGWNKDGNKYFIPAPLRPFYGTREPTNHEVSEAAKALRFQLYCEENPEYQAKYTRLSAFWATSQTVPGSSMEILTEWHNRELTTLEEFGLARHRAQLSAASFDLSVTSDRIDSIEKDRQENTCPICGEWPAPGVKSRSILNGVPGGFSIRSCSPCLVVIEDAHRAAIGQQELESGETRAAAAAAFLKNR